MFCFLVDELHLLVGGADLGGTSLAGAVLAFEDLLAHGGDLQLEEFDVGGVDADVDGVTLGVFDVNLVDVDDPLEAVDLGDLTFLTLELAAEDLNFVILADGEGLDVVLGAEFLAEAGGHEDTADVARGLEVSAAELAAGDGAVLLGVDGHFFCC